MTQSIEVLPSVRIQKQANKKKRKVAYVNKVLIGKFFLFHLDFKKVLVCRVLDFLYLHN